MYLKLSLFFEKVINQNLKYSKKNISQDSMGPKRRYYLWTFMLVLGIHQVIFKSQILCPYYEQWEASRGLSATLCLV